jgi:hypothetical protein
LSSPAGLHQQRQQSEAILSSSAPEFMAAYYAAFHLLDLADGHPETIRPTTVRVLSGLLENRTYLSQRQGLFLFRLAADGLLTIYRQSDRMDGGLAGLAEDRLVRALRQTDGHAHRAAAEALGSLPLGIRGRPLRLPEGRSAPAVDPDALLEPLGPSATAPIWMGRSLVAFDRESGWARVIKLATDGQPVGALAAETLWMDRLRREAFPCPVRFDPPAPETRNGGPLYRLTRLPSGAPPGLHPRRYAIAFTAPPGYFDYAVSDRGGSPDGTAFGRTLCRNAFLLGWLASRGIVHTAPIPLFHNRVQVSRRRDAGQYEWFRAGRLDRWLASCIHPNLGESGLRDFEHLTPVEADGIPLYRLIGTHFLSLLLLVGAHFRLRDPDRVGTAPDGTPVDARDRFRPRRMEKLITGLFRAYHRGFAGEPAAGPLPLDLDGLISRMIDEMGVDRHMTEVVRTADQDEMTEAEFRAFLRDRGMPEARIAGLEKGRSEVVIRTGPHLGDFNRPISLPELIRAVETLSGLTVLGRYRRNPARGRRAAA